MASRFVDLTDFYPLVLVLWAWATPSAGDASASADRPYLSSHHRGEGLGKVAAPKRGIGGCAWRYPPYIGGRRERMVSLSFREDSGKADAATQHQAPLLQVPAAGCERQSARLLRGDEGN